jgi:hypothetical protein
MVEEDFGAGGEEFFVACAGGEEVGADVGVISVNSAISASTGGRRSQFGQILKVASVRPPQSLLRIGLQENNFVVNIVAVKFNL